MATTVKTLKITYGTPYDTSQTLSLKYPKENIVSSDIATFNTDNAATGMQIQHVEYITTITDEKIYPSSNN